MATGFPLTVNGHTIRTSEALYQMCKFPHLAEAQELLLAQRSPIMLARIARAKARPPRPDWDTVKLATMRWAVRLKLAQNWDTFGKLLLETGDLEIVEDSHRDAVVGDEGRVPHGVPRRVVVVPPVGLDDEHAPVRGGQGEVSQVRTERHLGGERQAELGHCLRQLPLDRRHRRPVGLSDRVGAGEQDAHLREQGGELLAGQQSQRLGQGGLIAERQLARAEEVAATLGEEVERDTPTERGQDDTVDERLEFVALEKEALGIVLEDDAPDAVSKDGGRRGGREDGGAWQRLDVGEGQVSLTAEYGDPASLRLPDLVGGGSLRQWGKLGQGRTAWDHSRFLLTQPVALRVRNDIVAQ